MECKDHPLSNIFKPWCIVVNNGVGICWGEGSGMPNVLPKEELSYASWDLNMSTRHLEVKCTHTHK